MNISDFLSDHKSELITMLVTAIITMLIVVFFIERSKLSWAVKELVKLYSGEPSYFSKKRIESGIAFTFAFWMTTFYIKMKIDTMDIWAFGYILTVWLFIAGYTVSQIQSEKKVNVGGTNGGAPTDNSGGNG